MRIQRERFLSMSGSSLFSYEYFDQMKPQMGGQLEGKWQIKIGLREGSCFSSSRKQLTADSTIAQPGSQKKKSAGIWYLNSTAVSQMTIAQGQQEKNIPKKSAIVACEETLSITNKKREGGARLDFNNFDGSCGVLAF